MKGAKTSLEVPTIILLDEAKLTEVLNRVLDEKLHNIIPLTVSSKYPVPLDEYIPKAAIRGKLLASSTLLEFPPILTPAFRCKLTPRPNPRFSCLFTA